MAFHILLVDDDTIFRRAFRRTLKGYELSEAINGEDALSILKNPHTIDLVVLDEHLPGENGTELLKTIKYLNPELPVVILTGSGSKDIVVQALRGNADDYLEKTLHMEQTITRICDIVESKWKGANFAESSSNATIEKLKQFADKNYDKKITLNDLSKKMCLSPKHVSRLFKEVTGGTFSEYRLTKKISKAKEWLVSTGLNIDAISRNLGYLHTESFIRIFKKMEVLSPTEYRQKFTPPNNRIS
jgi:two-component system, response regulator YesN